MAAINTTQTAFAPNEQITSAKLNNILLQSKMDGGAVTVDGTITVISGQLQVGTLKAANYPALGITAGAIAADAVTTEKIASGAITLAKMATDSVGTDQIVDASITAPMLNGAQTGTAPIYGVRAWVSFDGTVSETSVGTVSRASGSTLATVTLSNHGMATGNIVNVAGGVATGIYTITKLTDNTFTFVTVATTLLSNVAITLYRRKINGSGNVNSIVDAGTAIYYINMTIPMSSANYATSWLGTSDGLSGYTYANTPQMDLKTTSSFQISFRGTDQSGSANQPVVDVSVIC